MFSFKQYIRESAFLAEGTESHAANYAAARRHYHRLQTDPDYERQVRTGLSSGHQVLQIPVSPVTAARAGGLPGMSTVTGHLQHRNPDAEQLDRVDFEGVYHPKNITNDPLNRMNLGSFSTISAGIIPHERQHAVQYSGAQVNAALKAATVSGTPANQRLRQYQANPSDENKQEFLDSLDIKYRQSPTTKAFSRFVSTVSGLRYAPETEDHIRKIMTLPHQTSEFDKEYPMYSFTPWEIDSRIQDSIHDVVKESGSDTTKFEENHGTYHLDHLHLFNQTGDVTHLKNFETHVRNAAITRGIHYNRSIGVHAYQANEYFDRLADHIGSGEMVRGMATPPTDVEGWKKNSLKALDDFRVQHERQVQQASKTAMGAAGLILTKGNNFGGRMLKEYEHLIAPQHAETFKQHVDQTFESMDPKFNLYK